jgi:hypothetical protein
MSGPQYPFSNCAACSCLAPSMRRASQRQAQPLQDSTSKDKLTTSLPAPDPEKHSAIAAHSSAALISLSKHQHYNRSTGNATRSPGHNHNYISTFWFSMECSNAAKSLRGDMRCFASIVRRREAFVPMHCLMGCLSSPHKALTRAAGLQPARLTF